MIKFLLVFLFSLNAWAGLVVGQTPPVFARAENNAGTSFTNATITLVPFATVNFDSGSIMDGVNKFTAPVAGTYLIHAVVTFTGVTAGTGNIITFIYKNGSVVLRGGNVPIGANQTSSSVTLVDKAVAGDYYQIYAFQNNGTARALESGSQSNHFDVIKY